MKKEKIFQYAFQTIIVLCFFVVIYILLTRVVPKENENVLNLIIGALIGSYLTVVNYSFSSTASSDKKTDIISKLPAIEEEKI